MSARTFAILCVVVGTGFYVYAATLLPSLLIARDPDAIGKVMSFFVLGTAFVAVAQHCGLLSAPGSGSDESGGVHPDGSDDGGCDGDAGGDGGGD